MRVNSREAALRFIDYSISIKKIMKAIAGNDRFFAVTEPQFRTLMVLNHEGRTSLKELGTHMMVSSPSLCIMLNKLYEQGLVNRESDEADRRNTFYSLSENGEKLLQDEMSRRVEYLGKLMEHLSDCDRAKLVESMESAVEIVKKLGSIDLFAQNTKNDV